MTSPSKENNWGGIFFTAKDPTDNSFLSVGVGKNFLDDEINKALKEVWGSKEKLLEISGDFYHKENKKGGRLFHDFLYSKFAKSNPSLSLATIEGIEKKLGLA